MKRRLLQLVIISSYILLISACAKEDEADLLSYKVKNQQAEIGLDGAAKQINITFPASLLTAENLIAEFQLSEGATATVGGTVQVSGQTANNFEVPFTYKIVAADGSKTIEWKVSATNNSSALSWGLGRYQEKANSNDRTYDWYLDQFNTGTYSTSNCGPTSTCMSAKWSSQTFSKTPENARSAYRPTGGWWYTADINNYLNDNSIPHSIIALSTTASGTQQAITSGLDAGNILILCLDMYYIRSEANSSGRVDKFYSASTTGWGHFIVLKGYRKVDDQIFYEVYDPYCNGLKYSDGTLKGKNRYYRNKDIFDATSIWWNYAFVISQSGGTKSSVTGLDPATVPSMWGR